jgi:DNA-binding MarR family transcriptional regulator
MSPSFLFVDHLICTVHLKIIFVKIICRESKGCYTLGMADSLEGRLGESAGWEGFVPRPLAEHMGWLMSRASQALGAALAEGLAPLGLNLRDYTVLLAAERAAIEGRPRAQLALAQAARLDKSTMVVALDALEGEGLVERRPDPKDRRARIVVPTDAGRELLARAEGVVLGAEDEALADLSVEERRALRGLLTRLVTGRRSAGDEPGSCR